VNAEAQRILGAPAGALDAAVGRDCRDALRAQPAVARLLLAALDGHERPSRAELTLAGVPARTIGFTLGAVRDDAGRTTGAALFFRDLAPIEHMDEQQRLRERLAALGQMAAGLAHEIRNPLAGMEVIAGLLRRRLEGRAEELALVGELVGELRSLAATVSASLEFVRPVDVVRTPADAVALLEDALAVALARLPFAGAIERRYAASLPPAFVDREQLRTVLVNLVLNALEAMSGRAGGRLRLVAEAESPVETVHAATWAISADAVERPLAKLPHAAVSDVLVLAVEDDGPGVPPELRERVFYPFFTTKERGSGVGLATAQKIVASHGGSLELESAPGHGARFVVRLPLGDPLAAAAGRAA
jgi:signal transduction histidine kinase